MQIKNIIKDYLDYVEKDFVSKLEFFREVEEDQKEWRHLKRKLDIKDEKCEIMVTDEEGLQKESDKDFKSDDLEKSGEFKKLDNIILKLDSKHDKMMKIAKTINPKDQ